MGRWKEDTKQRRRDRLRHWIACTVLALIPVALVAVYVLAAIAGSSHDSGFEGVFR